jgi:hypothetical protein
MPKYKGMCRIKGENGESNKVRVTDDDLIFDDVDEELYKLALYKPELEKLPWCKSGNGHENK